MIRCVWTETLRGNSSGERKMSPWENVSAGQRYAAAIAKLFGADIIHDMATYKRYAIKLYDVVFVGYSTIYSEYKADAELIKKQSNAKVVHVSTEYANACPASLFYAKRPFLHVANYERIPEDQKSGAWKFRDAFAHINVNAMLYRDSWRDNGQQRDGAIYWGRFRPDRAIYLRDVARAGVTISTSKKNIEDWINAGVNAETWVEKCTWQPGYETIRRYAYTVYCEDQYTHTNYNCPANRWYESLDADVQPLIHVSALPTFIRAGYSIPEIALYSSMDELKHKMSTVDIRNELSNWRNKMREIARDEKASVGIRLKGIVDGYISGTITS